jgi:hypothetical protein
MSDAVRYEVTDGLPRQASSGLEGMLNGPGC